VFLNNQAYAQTSRQSEWINVSIASNLSYIVYCSENCQCVIEWSVDDDFQIVRTDTFNLVGGSTLNIHIPVKFRYARFNVNNILSVPCDLKCQLFF